MVVGAPYAGVSDDTQGAAYLVLGPVSGSIALQDAERVFFYEDSGAEEVGRVLEVAKGTDDGGYGRIVVAHTGYVEVDEKLGAVFVTSGIPPTGDLAEAASRLVGVHPSGGFGSTISCGRDLNGDGSDDFVISAPETTRELPGIGALHLFYELEAGVTRADEASAGITHGLGDDSFGSAVSLLGDLHDDGFDDLVVSDLGAADGAGAVFVVSGGGL